MCIALLAAVPASAAPPIIDQFGRPDGPLGTTDTGQAWQASASAWAIRSGRARAIGTTSYGYATVPVASASSFVVEADITLSPTYRRANAGLTVLWRDHRNHVFCKIEVTAGRPSGLMSIGRMLNGTVTSLLAYRAGTGFVNGRTYHVACSRSGSTLRMMVAGGGLPAPLAVTYAMTSSDLAAFGTAMRAGLRSRFEWDEDDGRSTWDNFRVAA